MRGTDRDYFSVQSVQRALRVLEHLALRSAGAGVTEVSEALGLQKSTVHRLLLTMERAGYVQHVPDTGKYALGVKVFELGRGVPAVERFRRVVHPHLHNLASAFRETAQFAILDQTEIVYICKFDASERMLRLHADVGMRLPAYCTGPGKAILAFLPPEICSAILRKTTFQSLTPRTVMDAGTLERQFEIVRAQGYAVDDGEHQDVVRSVAAPVFDTDAKVVGAVNLMMVASSLPYHHLAEVAEVVKQTASHISAQLGGVAATLNVRDI